MKKQTVGMLWVVTVLALSGGCQKKPEPVASVPTQAESVPATEQKIINMEPKPGETIELGGDGPVNYEGDSAPPTAEPTPSEGKPVQ